MTIKKNIDYNENDNDHAKLNSIILKQGFYLKIRRPFASQIYSYVFFRQTVKALIRLVDAHIYCSYFLCDSSSNTLLASEYEDENLTQLSNCQYKTYRFSSAFHRLPMKIKSFRYKIGVWMIPSCQNHSETASVLKSKVSEYLGTSETFLSLYFHLWIYLPLNGKQFRPWSDGKF